MTATPPSAPSGVPSTQPPATPPAEAPKPTLADLYDVSDEQEPVEFSQEPPEPQVAAAATPEPAKPAGATPVSAVSPAPSPAPQARHPAWLTAKATAFGIHPVVVEKLDTTELTQIVMETMQSQLAGRADASRQATFDQAGNPAQPAVVSSDGLPQAQQAQQEPAFDWGVHDDVDDLGNPVKRKYTDEDINPAIASVIKRQAAEIAELKKFLGGVAQHANETAEQARQRQFDSAFDRIPTVFGTGDPTALRGKPEFERRRAVYNAVKGMFQALPPEARDKMTIEQAVFAMAGSLFGVQPPGAAAAATPHPGDKFAGGGVAVPTSRKPSGRPLGTERAKEVVSQWWQEQSSQNGSMPHDGDTTLDELI